MPAQAAPQQFGPRAGSNLSGIPNQYGQMRRPYRRRQPQAAQTQDQLDYRLNDFEESGDSDFAFHDGSFENSLDQTGFCDDCSCGDCVEPGCGCDDYCEPSCGCEDSCCNIGNACNGGGMGWGVGFEWTFVKPRFSQNISFTTLFDTGTGSTTFTDSEFDYDLELAPRVWLGVDINEHWGWRVSYWQYDQDPDTATTSPDDNTFGRISTPPFADVDFFTTIFTDTFTAASSLDAYTIDIEALKQARLNGWRLGVGGGVRYASVRQSYSASIRNVGGNLLDQLDFGHDLEGFGPTASLSAKRPLARNIKLVFAARGSLLYGNSSSRLFTREDILTTELNTTRVTNREDLLGIGEARVGLEWMTPKKRSNGFQWLLSTAMEGQLWNNAGNAASETADLGFFGFNFGAGLVR